MTAKEKATATMTRWLEDKESWIGVFRNEELGHPRCGHTFALCFDDSDWDGAEVGKTRAPDAGHEGPGYLGMMWRYILIAKTRSVDDAIALIFTED